MKLYMQSRNNKYDARAEYDIQNGQFIVLKGSRVSDSISTAPTFRSIKTVKRMRQQYVDGVIVVSDVCFSSPSSAANFVTGSSTDGTKSWKSEDGRSLKVLLTEVKE